MAAVVAGMAVMPGAASGSVRGAAAGFNLPSAVAVDGAGNLVIADTGNNRIREVAG
jgi:hypothetical protein